MPDLLSQPILGFVGVNLRRDRLSLADGEVSRAINADFHTFLGAATRRLGTKRQNQTALGDALTAVVRHIGKLTGAARYRVAGRSIFRGSTRIADQKLSASFVTKMAAMRPLLDNATWMFFADDALMWKDDGLSTQTWGLNAPTRNARLFQANSGSVRNGTYSVKHTYARKTSDGKLAYESNPSPASAVVLISGLPANGSILVSRLEECGEDGATHIRIYRSLKNDTTEWFFALEIPNKVREFGYCNAWEADEITDKISGKVDLTVSVPPKRGKGRRALPQPRVTVLSVTTVPGDVVADERKWQFATEASGFATCYNWEADPDGDADSETAALTSDPLSTNQGVGVQLVLEDGNLGVSVLTNNDPPPLASWCCVSDNTMFLVRDAENPSYLRWSKRFQPESWPLDNFIEIGDPNDPLLAVVSWLGMLTVWTALTKYRVTGDGLTGFISQEAISRRGTAAPFSIVPSQYGIAFVAHDGVFLANMIAEDAQIAGDILPIFQGETVNGFLPVNWSAASTICAAGWKNRLYIAYPSGSATAPDMLMVYSVDTGRWYFYDLPLSSLGVEEETDELIAGGQDGFAYVLEDGESDQGHDVAFEVQTKDFFGPSPEVRKLFRYFRADVDADLGSVNAEFYVDDRLIATKTLTGARTRILQRLPAATGYSWRLRFVYTGTRRPRVYGATAVFQPLGAA